MSSSAILVIFLGICFHFRFWTSAQLPDDAHNSERHSTCGTRFTDPASSAILADIILQGIVEDLRQASPLSPLLYKANVTVEKVYKGETLLSVQNEDGRKSLAQVVTIERFGPQENGENCIARVLRDQTYLFFLKVKASLDGPNVGAPRSVQHPSQSNSPVLLQMTALPLQMDWQILKQAKKVMCPGCSFQPVIQKLVCKNCASAPSMPKKMVMESSKVVMEGSRLSLRCVARGSPSPSYTWFKNGRLLNGEDTKLGNSLLETNSDEVIFESGDLSIHTTKRHSLLRFRKVRLEDRGTYRCLATNAVGESEQTVDIMVKEDPHTATDLNEDNATESPSSADIHSEHEREGPCAINPCYHGGTCHADDATGPILCLCHQQHFGNRCQFKRRPVSEEEEDATQAGSLTVSSDENRRSEAEYSPTSLKKKKTSRIPLPGEDYTDGNDDDQTDDNHGRDNISTELTVEESPGDLDPSTSQAKVKMMQKIDDEVKEAADSKSTMLKAMPDKQVIFEPAAQEPREAKSEKILAPGQLKLSDCPDQTYCLNGGTCKIVVKLQKKFCQCLTGYAGRRCELII